jgi:hypothetical protein
MCHHSKVGRPIHLPPGLQFVINNAVVDQWGIEAFSEGYA